MTTNYVTQNTSQKLQLYWLCKQTGRKIPAGVAFYNEQQGDYRLKIDTFTDEKVFFLKPSSVYNGKVLYRLESAIRKDGRVMHRAEIGTGFSEPNEGLPIYMDVGPYSKYLVMEQAV